MNPASWAIMRMKWYLLYEKNATKLILLCDRSSFPLRINRAAVKIRWHEIGFRRWENAMIEMACIVV